jgi:glycosyltransferase involved in cell wall biosynthesis
MACVDVVVPCYNYGEFLRECVMSVLTQEGVDLRVAIVDNASSDDSLAVADQLAATDNRVEVIAHQVNRGATFSYNEGIDWASSDYFLILDADDLLAPGALARAVEVLDREPRIAFTHGIEARLESDGSICADCGNEDQAWVVSTGREFIERLCRTPVNNIGANTVVRRTAIQKAAGYYRPSLPYTDDLEMWLRLATLGDAASIRSVQAIRRYHQTRGSVYYQSVQFRDFVEREAAFTSFFVREGRQLADAGKLLEVARRGLGEHAYWSAASHLARGHIRTGVRLLGFSHRRRPNAFLMPAIGWLRRMDRPLGRIGEIVSGGNFSRNRRISVSEPPMARRAVALKHSAHLNGQR